jgi:hypothetical protein
VFRTRATPIDCLGDAPPSDQAAGRSVAEVANSKHWLPRVVSGVGAAPAASTTAVENHWRAPSRRVVLAAYPVMVRFGGVDGSAPTGHQMAPVRASLAAPLGA